MALKKIRSIIKKFEWNPGIFWIGVLAGLSVSIQPLGEKMSFLATGIFLMAYPFMATNGAYGLHGTINATIGEAIGTAITIAILSSTFPETLLVLIETAALAIIIAPVMSIALHFVMEKVINIEGFTANSLHF